MRVTHPRVRVLPDQALVLLDALGGDGGAFWEDYANGVLPQPQALSLPLCLPPELMPQLQHLEVILAAQKQQVCVAMSHFLAASLWYPYKKTDQRASLKLHTSCSLVVLAHFSHVLPLRLRRGRRDSSQTLGPYPFLMLSQHS
jgi:hypothetical protein